LTVSKTALNEYFANGNGRDSVHVTIAFTDGEGGIGPVPGGTDNTHFIICDHAYDSIVIADPFYNVFCYEYHASHISTDSCLAVPIQSAYVPDSPKNPSISGTIEVNAIVECPATGNVDTVSFSYFFKDRAGKVSNRMRTPPIIITCQ
jgi:hypothetical protein